MVGFATTSGLGSGAAKTVGRALIKKEAKSLVQGGACVNWANIPSAQPL